MMVFRESIGRTLEVSGLVLGDCLLSTWQAGGVPACAEVLAALVSVSIRKTFRGSGPGNGQHEPAVEPHDS